MTLCIAWKDADGNIHLASDSRITVANNSFEDVAVKLTRVSCEIFPPSSGISAGEGEIRISLGMAFAGSHLCAYVIKESLVEVLGRLQYVPGATEISMDKIAKLAFHAYEKLSKKICATSIGRKGICEIFLVGYCPKARFPRAFKLSTDAQSNTHSCAEILRAHSMQVELSGSGKNAPSLQANLSTSPLRALKDVIDDPTRDDVGGAYQYGICTENFRIFCEYLIDQSGWPAYMRAGLNINTLISANLHDDLFIAPLICDLNN
ncbi:hypothetical protein VDF90_04245 [Xanthomonas campestris pv. raphani]|uniref:hypothetical protein n=1 Tax=Xanthomonas campestris TaxID=339 RepID=UPI002B23653A|nr:hypothetical protein [Xanthomonas campestris]MEA9786472.1 hypothetical protein [Xanthomonas campestris pv. raphani]